MWTFFEVIKPLKNEVYQFIYYYLLNCKSIKDSLDPSLHLSEDFISLARLWISFFNRTIRKPQTIRLLLIHRVKDIYMETILAPNLLLPLERHSTHSDLDWCCPISWNARDGNILS